MMRPGTVCTVPQMLPSTRLCCGPVFATGATIIALNLTLLVKGTGQISPTLGVPTYLLYAAPVVGFASLAFRYLLRLLSVRDARRWPVAPAWLAGSDES
jgi:TRAP-type C4-dicarboxylate transport system permease small subunit